MRRILALAVVLAVACMPATSPKVQKQEITENHPEGPGGGPGQAYEFWLGVHANGFIGDTLNVNVYVWNDTENTDFITRAFGSIAYTYDDKEFLYAVNKLPQPTALTVTDDEGTLSFDHDNLYLGWGGWVQLAELWFYNRCSTGASVDPVAGFKFDTESSGERFPMLHGGGLFVNCTGGGSPPCCVE